MALVANLDAAIEEHYAEIGDVEKELQIFGRVWNLIPTLTTAQLDPLAKIQAAAEIVSDPTRLSTDDHFIAIKMLAHLNEILSLVIVESQREQFRHALAEKGIPIPVAPMIIEAIFTAYDAAPLPSGSTTALTNTTTSQEPTTHIPRPVSTIGSGSLSENVGQASSPNYGISPDNIEQFRKMQAEEKRLTPYESQIPQEIENVPLG